MASQATKMAVRGNKHMVTMAIEVPDFNSKIKWPQRQLNWVLWEDSHGEHHKLISHCPCCPLVHRAITLLFFSQNSDHFDQPLLVKLASHFMMSR